ncbi:uncharacterized protein LOC115979685 isoform X2 [Quercus lobata]|uniref:uncharacterized protein LOC115975693 isoform X2 n=1 Tax=Quercus lobata TaxID=97700 RepID=UPI001248F576|nr:uncharacterized protein LOC115975693 isoform X2 [Quercus lobata]XP_030957608.1 uncharacterized protein LOC115979685 isoform X2 [Quercus lobata]
MAKPTFHPKNTTSATKNTDFSIKTTIPTIPTNQQRLFLANSLLLPPKCRPTHNCKPQTTADPPTTASHKPPTCNLNNPQTPLRTTHPNPPVGDTPSHPTHPSKLAQRTKSIEFRSYLQIPAIAKCIIEKCYCCKLKTAGMVAHFGQNSITPKALPTSFKIQISKH